MSSWHSFGVQFAVGVDTAKTDVNDEIIGFVGNVA
jgi:hypothetical protein